MEKCFLESLTMDIVPSSLKFLFALKGPGKNIDKICPFLSPKFHGLMVTGYYVMSRQKVLSEWGVGKIELCHA